MTFSGSSVSINPATVFVALGSNLDHPAIHVKRAFQEIDEMPETELEEVSNLYETAPVGIKDQPPFVNAVARVATLLDPHAFLAQLHAIEAQHGRDRNSPDEKRNGPRTLDLDILLFGEMEIDEHGLTVPHPRMHQRAFVLVPLVEIAPTIFIPGKGSAKGFLATVGSAGVGPLQWDGLS